MKALSIKNPWAGLIYHRMKSIETRKWWTDYRGDILICCSRILDDNILGVYEPECYITGQAICVVELYSVVSMKKEHQRDAMCKIYYGAYAWLLRNIRQINPVPVKGQLGLFNIPEGTIIKYL
jgi:hypothetical protein